MKYEYIGKGKTREDASAAAKAGLMAELSKAGVKAPNEADIHEEVITMPKKKILGIFGGCDAEVKACYDDGKKERKPQPKKAKAPSAKREAPAKKAERPAPAVKRDAPKKAEAPVVSNEAEVIITEKDVDMNAANSYLEAMLKGLKIDDVKVEGRVVDGVLEMTVECEDYGIIIGRRGETLDSLQYLTSLAVKKTSGKYVRVVLNVANYREKRAETVKNLARKNANYVLRTGRRYTFEPMNPYERRIIHTTIQEIEGVESMSVGFGQDRKVVLQPTGGAKYQPRSGGRRQQSSGRAPAQKAPAAPKDFTKFGKIEVNKD